MTPTPWTQNNLAINGITPHYYHTDDGSKQPLILAHGFSDNGLYWLQTAVDLEEGYDIIMADARVYGLSDRIQDG